MSGTPIDVLRGTHVLAIDQGTTSTRAIVFDGKALPVATQQQEFRQIFPHPGWVEHDPEEIWQSVLNTGRAVIAASGQRLAAMGITNQRETTVVWNRHTGQPIYNAIVWQDRRTAALCDALKVQGHETWVTAKTGLLLDPYFPASKIAWLLDHVPDARAQAERGELAFGTVDCFLLWRLTNGQRHTTDATNASRSLLFDIHTGQWDDGLLGLFNIPRSLLPEVLDCAADFGMASPEHFGQALPILGMAGDQQAALIGQACFAPGMVKSTYGTGCFVLLNTGAAAVKSSHRLLTTIAYQFAGKRTYASEGAIFSAGATVQWLRDGLGIIGHASECAGLAAAANPDERVYILPAFAGLGAPYWNSAVRGAVVGLTRGTGRAEMVRAALESVAFQTRDLIEAMRADGDLGDTVIRVDGGMSVSDWTMQGLADILAAPVDRPVVIETTALGAAYLAGWHAGLYPEPNEFARTWHLERRFTPTLAADEREERYAGWQAALRRLVT